MEGSDDLDTNSSVSRGIRLKKKIKIFYTKSVLVTHSDHNLRSSSCTRVYDASSSTEYMTVRIC